jgi:hypothetical protein
MSEALACFCCESPLEMAVPPEQGGSELQPYAGTNFDTEGHYGSTVFDPLATGDKIYINICDDCIRDRAAKGLVLTRVAYLSMFDERGVIVGRQWIDRGFVPWNPELDYNEDRINIEDEEVGDPSMGRWVEWTPEARKEWERRVQQSQG